MEVLHTAPNHDQFTPLSSHQSQTPASFYSGPPVLHHYSPSSTILTTSHDLASSPAITALAPRTWPQTNGSASHTVEENSEDAGEEVSIQGIDIWVTSDKFLLFSSTRSTGLAIPYPSISLHAIQRSPQPSLLLQILTGNGPQFDDHDPDGTISITIVPSATMTSTTSEPHQQQEQDPASSSTPPESSTLTDASTPSSEIVSALFTALSACADLHPDPSSGSDLDVDDQPAYDYDVEPSYTQIDGLPPPMPGSGGWITADNVGEFVDEEGNFRGRSLGAGAGVVRGREEDDDDGDGEGHGGERVADGNGVEGVEEETKWRRTG
ncbi:MAG: hypothetical protein Q9220_005530 [cf. Caloplaca sp. 1 TL-2023]